MMDTVELEQSRGRYFLPLKMVMIAFLTLVLLIPVALISSIIEERQGISRQAIAEIGRAWGNPQQIGGPILVIPYRSTVGAESGKDVVVIRRAFLLPETVNIKAEVAPEKRQRGIYESVVYRISASCSGTFSLPSLDHLRIPEADILWDQSFLVVGIPDMKGISEEIGLSFASQRIDFNPGTRSVSFLPSGIHAPLLALSRKGSPIPFSFEIGMNGSQSVSFLPLGKETTVTVRSQWPDPSFEGAFLPAKHSVTADGFDARWAVSYFGRSYPQAWTSDSESPTGVEQSINASSFGVRLLIPIDFYRQVTRSVKYSILFIALTFLGFFLHEVFKPLRIHPLQYLLVGFSLCVFYLLLLSSSEYVSFGLSYLLASAATVALITGYSSVILKNKKRSTGLAMTLIGLYGYLYILLQIEDYALLVGSIGLFVVLSVIMYITRHVDWYGVNLVNTRPQQKK